MYTIRFLLVLVSFMLVLFVANISFTTATAAASELTATASAKKIKGGSSNSNGNQQHTSIPRSTRQHTSVSALAALDNSDDEEDNASGSNHHNNRNSFLSGNNEHRPPWNPSPQIDESGFLIRSYTRIPGEWEAEVHLGGKYSTTYSRSSSHFHHNNEDNNDDNYNDSNMSSKKKKKRNMDDDDADNDFDSLNCNNLLLQIPVKIRQVPGDGNCLFHSISTCSAYATNGTHVDFNNHHGLRWLYKSSATLRQQAVDCLRKKKLLFLQGKEYLRSTDLVRAAAAQYGITPEEYCDLMQQDSYWGGGPEIVALCNVLKRPIHVYELATSTSKNDPTTTIATNHKSQKQFVLRRMACFGSPKFDYRQPFHILSADSRFPDIPPGKQLPAGNHFLAVFPQHDLLDEIKRNNRRKKKKQKKKTLRARGGGDGSASTTSDDSSMEKQHSKPKSSSTTTFSPGGNSNNDNINDNVQLQAVFTLKDLFITIWKKFFFLNDL